MWMGVEEVADDTNCCNLSMLTRERIACSYQKPESDASKSVFRRKFVLLAYPIY